MWPFEREISVEEARETVHISKMRNALYDLIWAEAHKNDKRPMPRPLLTNALGDADVWIIDELKEIVGG